MSRAEAMAVGRDLVRLFAEGGVAGLDDRRLVERFARKEEGGSAAFEAILLRHGPAVLATCRRVLGGSAFAEDAFQATFLVLVRRAGSIRVGDSLAPWLLGVARRTALKARAAERRRQAREARVAVPESAESPAATIDEALPLVRAEVDRLPSRYRDPVRLCYFEGRTHDEAAAVLRCPVGTVRGRLSRARGLLRPRLLRRGLAPAGLLAGSADVRAEVPEALVEAMMAVATRGADVAPRVAALASGAWRTIVAAVGLVALLSSVAGLAAMAMRDDDPPRPATTVASPRESPRLDRLGMPLPDGALARMGQTRFNTGGPLCHAFYTPDGRGLVTAGQGNVLVWDAVTGRVLREIGSPAIPTFRAAISPDMATLATTEFPSGLRLWDFATGRELLRIDPAPDGWATHLTYSPDGSTLAAAVSSRKSGIVLWDAVTLAERVRFGGDWIYTQGLVFAPDGKTLATGSKDFEKPLKGSVRLWDVATGREVWRVPIAGATVSAIAFLPGGKRLAAATSDRTIRLLDPADGREVAPRLGPFRAGPKHDPAEGAHMVFSPDGTIVASAENQSAADARFAVASIHLWDVSRGAEIRQIPAHRQMIGSLAFAPDGKTLVSAGIWETSARVWDVATGREVFAEPGHRRGVAALVVSPEDGSIFTAGDGTLLRWDADGRHDPVVVGEFDARIAELAVSRDGKVAVVTRIPDAAHSSGERNSVAISDLSGGRKTARFSKVVDRQIARHVSFSPDGKTLASSTRTWDVATGRERAEFRHEDKESRGGAGYAPIFFSPDGSRAIINGWGGVRVHDVATGAEVGRPIPPWRVNYAGSGLALSPDGRLLARGNCGNAGDPKSDLSIRVWELASGKEVATLEGLEGTSSGLDFSPDGRYLASARQSLNGESGAGVRIWDVASGAELRRFHGPRNGAKRVAYRPDGRSVVSAGDDGQVIVWDVSDLADRRPDPAPDAKALERHWADLGLGDAPRAHRASWALSAAGAVPYLRDRLRPAAAPDPARLAAMVADLDADDPASRARAAEALAPLAEASFPALLRAVRARPSAATPPRVADLLAASKEPVSSPDVLRPIRAIASLERAATPEALAVLHDLASGDADARQTVEAKKALDRLGRRSRAR